ncbi:hypothetical protein D6D02_10517 [Aureobasidium pullulans]|nr:hypothetical protein D6D02_10517 [Aureobasidium pullulans]
MAPVETPKGLFLRVNRADDQDQALDFLLNVKMVANTLRGPKHTDCRSPPWQPKPEAHQEYQPTRRAAQRDGNSLASHVDDSGRVSKSGPKPKRMNKNWTPQGGGRK